MQGFNMGRYVPPDQEGVTSANKLAGKHPLGSRARNVNSSGELTVRFEMPFPVWCSTCKPPQSASNTTTDNNNNSNNNSASTTLTDATAAEQRPDASDPEHVLIGQGVRFNAHKKRVGNYYSTPVWSFRMKHPACGGWIEIRTDPKNAEYVVVEGARRKVTAPQEDAGPLGLWIEEGGGDGGERKGAEILMGRSKAAGEGEEGGKGGGERDPFAKFENKVSDERGFMTARTRMDELRKRQERDWEDPYEKSRKLRRAFRAERKGREAAQTKADALRDKMSLGIELAGEQDVDRLRAGLVDFGSAGDRDPAAEAVRTRGLFESSTRSTKLKPDTAEAKMSKKDRTKRKGRENKKKSTAAGFGLQERKDALRQALRGNTRAAIDPFLTDEKKAWQPGFSVRRKTKFGEDSPSAPRSLLDKNGQRNGAGVSPGTEDVPLKANCNSGNVGSQQQSSVLVHYASDTD